MFDVRTRPLYCTCGSSVDSVSVLVDWSGHALAAARQNSKRLYPIVRLKLKGSTRVYNLKKQKIKTHGIRRVTKDPRAWSDKVCFQLIAQLAYHSVHIICSFVYKPICSTKLFFELSTS